MGKSVFNIGTSIYGTAKGYVAPPFVPISLIQRKSNTEAASFDTGDYAEKGTQSMTGSPLRKFVGGIYYFMPVTITHDGTTWEFDNAVVSVTGKKLIVETPLTGRQGTVKELISLNDYEIKLIVVISDDDYPEEELQKIIKLYEVNAAVSLSCVITDYLLLSQSGEEKGVDDKVVIKDIDFPAMEGEEDSQTIVFTLLSDQNFELEL